MVDAELLPLAGSAHGTFLANPHNCSYQFSPTARSRPIHRRPALWIGGLRAALNSHRGAVRHPVSCTLRSAWLKEKHGIFRARAHSGIRSGGSNIF